MTSGDQATWPSLEDVECTPPTTPDTSSVASDKTPLSDVVVVSKGDAPADSEGPRSPHAKLPVPDFKESAAARDKDHLVAWVQCAGHRYAVSVVTAASRLRPSDAVPGAPPPPSGSRRTSPAPPRGEGHAATARFLLKNGYQDA